MRAWPAVAWQLLAAAVLALAALPASTWAGLYCYYFSPANWPEHERRLAGPLPAPSPGKPPSVDDAYFVGSQLAYQIPGAVAALIWILGMAAYVWWVRRIRIGLALAIVPLAVFCYFSWRQLLHLYPVCDTF